MVLSSTVDHLKPSYDYIVLGGGTAGCVIANRLSEDSNVSVLVVEAGQHRPDDPTINIPGLMAGLYDKPEYDWSYFSEPQVPLTHAHRRRLQGTVVHCLFRTDISSTGTP